MLNDMAALVSANPNKLEPTPKLGWAYIALLYSPLLMSVFLAKLSIPGFSDKGLGVVIPITSAIAIGGLLSGALVFHRRLALFYVGTVSWMLLVQVAADRPYSASSLALMVIMFLPFAFQLRPALSSIIGLRRLDVLQAFSNLACFCAGCGIVQYAAQFVLPASVAFPLEHWLPQGILIQGFNYLNPVSYGSTIYKSNGIFFLEPSFFSQFTALGLLLELSSQNRLRRVALYVAALFVAYSGTGIIILLVGGAALLFGRQRWQLLLSIAAAVAIIAVLSQFTNLDALAGRATEFSSTRSSGFERFVAWTYMFEQHWLTHVDRVLIGTGAGSFRDVEPTAQYSVAEMSFSKMYFEFGIIGGTAFFLMQFLAIFSIKAPVSLQLGLAASLFMNGAYSTAALGLLLTLGVWPQSSVSEVPSEEPDGTFAKAAQVH